MSDLTDRIAAEHWHEYYDLDVQQRYCKGCHAQIANIAAHVAEVTEAAVREQVAADIEAISEAPVPMPVVTFTDDQQKCWRFGVKWAAHIARGGTQ